MAPPVKNKFYPSIPKNFITKEEWSHSPALYSPR